jgi:hypothetical protein
VSQPVIDPSGVSGKHDLAAVERQRAEPNRRLVGLRDGVRDLRPHDVRSGRGRRQSKHRRDPTVRLKLWDESRGRLVTFAEARAD